MGWTPAVFPRLVKWSPSKTSERISIVLAEKHRASHYTHVAQSLFGLTHRDAENLFSPIYALEDSATPKQVAKRIRKFVRLTERATRQDA